MGFSFVKLSVSNVKKELLCGDKWLYFFGKQLPVFVLELVVCAQPIDKQLEGTPFHRVAAKVR